MAKTIVKVEKKIGCVKNKFTKPKVEKALETGAPLNKKETNDFNYKLKKAPPAIKQFYDGTLKFKKMNDEEKDEFVKAVLGTESFKCTYFNRFHTVSTKEVDKDEDEWMSWTQITKLDGPTLVGVQIEQGKIKTRPRKQLDHEHESTLKLPEEERLQYRRTKETCAKSHEDVKSWTRGSNEEPDDNGDDGDDETEDKLKKVMGVVRKAHNTFQSNFIDFKIKLGKYQGNKYPSRGCPAGASLVTKNDNV